MSKNKDRVSVGFVILVWNSQNVIKACLSSILNMDDIDTYVVLIDNGSTDHSIKYAQNIIKDDNSFEIIRYKKNIGTTVSRNLGLLKLKEKNVDYYCILDSDTIVNQEAFIKMTYELENHHEYGIIGPQMIDSKGISQISARAFPTLLEKLYKGIPIKTLQKLGEKMELQSPKYDDLSSYSVDYLMSACWLLRPEAVEKVGLLDEKIFYAPEDAEYCIRMWKAGYKIAFCPQAQIIHEWQRLSKKKLISKMNWEHIKGLAYMFIKHKYMFNTKKLRRTFITQYYGEK